MTYFMMIVLFPLLGLIVNSCSKQIVQGSQIATLTVWIGLINAIIAWTAWKIGLPFFAKSAALGFMANEISWLMATLILFVSGIVHHFSLRYLAGDRVYRRYFLSLTGITVTTLLMVAADNIVVLITFWSISNLLLVLLMVHKLQWKAAKNAGILALKTFLLGLIFLSIGAGLLAYESGTLSLHLIGKLSDNVSAHGSLPHREAGERAMAVRHSEELIAGGAISDELGRADMPLQPGANEEEAREHLRDNPSSPTRMVSLFFIMLAAFTQSGIWPFHRWLISSLNSPTPVSSLMHAGLVNGGGLLLARFALIFLHESGLLDALFLFGLITLVLGGIWKLIQSNIKRMLACSTMTQMGFMLMQCGLGFFSAALAHLCWHGLFKSFLFLRAGSAIAETQRTDEERTSAPLTFLLASLCGAMGAFGFVLGNDFSSVFQDTTAILLLFAWMAATQMAHTLLEKKLSLFSLLLATVVCFLAGLLYGVTVDLIEEAVASLGISQPQSLNAIHLVGVGSIVCIWLAMNLKPFANHDRSVWWRRFYVRMLNASQPDANTVTSRRDDYHC